MPNKIQRHAWIRTAWEKLPEFIYEGSGDASPWLLFGIVWKRNGPMFSFSDGWSEDQNHGKDKVGSVVSLDETMQLPWQEKILT